MIAKWTLPPVGMAPAPTGRMLSVAEQEGQLVCWTDTLLAGGTQVMVAQTGQNAPNADGWRFVGTAVMFDGRYVVHVFVLEVGNS